MDDTIFEERLITDDTVGDIKLTQGVVYKLINPDGRDVGGFTFSGKTLAGDPGNGIVTLYDIPRQDETVFIDVNYKGGQLAKIENCTDGDHIFVFVSNKKQITLNPCDYLTADPMPFKLSWTYYSRSEKRDKIVSMECDPLPDEHAILVQYSISDY